MSKCKHEPIIEGGMNPCLNCPPIPTQASMDKLVMVGFGVAIITCDGKTIRDGEDSRRKRPLTFTDAEHLAAKKPKADWRVILHGPLHGETYQRQGKECWVIIERNMGFA